MQTLWKLKKGLKIIPKPNYMVLINAQLIVLSLITLFPFFWCAMKNIIIIITIENSVVYYDDISLNYLSPSRR